MLERVSVSDRDWLSLGGTPYEGREHRFRHLWLVAAATYGVGDIVTTVAVIFFHPELNEANPLLRQAARTWGHLGIVPLKLFVFVLFIAISVYFARNDEELLSYAPPVVLTVMGGLVTVYNILGMLG